MLYTPPLRVALAGFGTVGRAVARRLCDDPESGLRLTHICNRGVERKRCGWIPAHVLWTDQIDDALGGDVDVLIELIGGIEPARTWVRAALLAGKSVVTANKQVIARHGPELVDLARRQGRELRYEASVAGAVPVLRALQDGLSGDRISRIEGLLNGTSNYILSRIETDGATFDEALREAQALGFAEADPSDDVDGADAQAKLAILGSLAFSRHVPTDAIRVATIRGIGPGDFAEARRANSTLRQVAVVNRVGARGICGAVGPARVPLDSWMARTTGSQNVVTLYGTFGGPITLAGAGAGGDPTAVAVLSDLYAIERSRRRAVLADVSCIGAE